ncbi:MAG: ribose-5-phosphate isomerase RpiA [Anaerolineales bacterium]|nr:ribose-5-phosphate isomerase RpiA [Anaerolineales bacterium]
MDQQALKKEAGEKAVTFVQSGMVVGLGHGSTAIFAVRKIAELLQSGELRDIVGIPCSKHVEADATALGIPLSSLNNHPIIDITIDGADEVDPQFNVIKGGGGALLREKIVAQATKREIIVVDQTKLSDSLGTNWRVPIEVTPFGWKSQAAYLESIGGDPKMRLDTGDEPFYTDQGNLILDTAFGPIADVYTLAAKLNARAGIVEHGLFLDLVKDVIVARENGIEHHTKIN